MNSTEPRSAELHVPWYKGLRVQMLGTLLAVLALAFAVTYGVILHKQRQIIADQAHQQAGAMANALLSSLQTLMLAGDADYAHDWLERVRSHPGLRDVQILRRDGSEAFRDLETIRQVNAFIGSDRFSRAPLAPKRPDNLPAAETERVAGGESLSSTQDHQLTFLLPIRKGEACNACHGYDASPTRGILRVTVSTEATMQQLASMQRLLSLLAILTVCLLALFAYGMIRRHILVPIDQMIRATGQIAAGNLGVRVPKRFQDEIALLAHAFNRMSENLEQTTVSRDYVDQILHSLGDMLFVVDDAGRIVLTNPAATQALGYSREELLGRPIGDITLSESLPATGEAGGQVLERWFVTQAGEKLPVLVSISALASNRSHQVIYAARDITKQKAAERELRLAAKVMDTVTSAIMVADADANIKLVNPAFCAITGYAPEEIIGKNPRILQSGRQSKEFYQEMWRAMLEEGFWEGEIWNKRKDGEIYPEWLTVSTMYDDSGRMSHFVTTFEDITERKRILSDLEHLANHDPLTGLPNRNLFIDRLTHAMQMARRAQRRAALVFIDIDGFKPINDAHGHDVGDHLLQAIARRLQERVRDADTVARIGGDEFVIIMENVDSHACVMPVAEKILAGMCEPFDIDGIDCRIGASIGISVYPDDSRELDELVKQADTAMYLAKSSGRNRICLYSRDCR